MTAGNPIESFLAGSRVEVKTRRGWEAATVIRPAEDGEYDRRAIEDYHGDTPRDDL